MADEAPPDESKLEPAGSDAETAGARGRPAARASAAGQASAAGLSASALQFVAEALHARRCSLLIVDEATGQLVIQHAIGLPPEARRDSPAARLRVADRVLRSGAPLLVEDVRAHPEFDRAADRGYQTPSFICVPVADETSVYGVVNVADREDGAAFTPADLTLITYLARHLADCIKYERRQLRGDDYATQIRALKQRLLALQEDERARIAREIHDEAGQALAVATFRLDLAAEQLPPEVTPVRELLAEARRALTDCGAQLHRVALNLRPRLLEELGLVAALRSLLDPYQHGAPRFALVVDGEERRLDPALELSAFRLVQEAVTNVRRHAHAATGQVRLGYEPRVLSIVVQDDGVGFDPLVAWAASGSRPRLGLLGMMERVRLHGGDLQINSAPGQGTTIRCTLPLEPRTDADHPDLRRRSR